MKYVLFFAPFVIMGLLMYGITQVILWLNRDLLKEIETMKVNKIMFGSEKKDK